MHGVYQLGYATECFNYLRNWSIQGKKFKRTDNLSYSGGVCEIKLSCIVSVLFPQCGVIKNLLKG